MTTVADSTDSGFKIESNKLLARDSKRENLCFKRTFSKEFNKYS